MYVQYLVHAYIGGSPLSKLALGQSSLEVIEQLNGGPSLKACKHQNVRANYTILPLPFWW